MIYQYKNDTDIPFLEGVTNFIYSPVTDSVCIFVLRVEIVSNIGKSGADF